MSILRVEVTAADTDPQGSEVGASTMPSWLVICQLYLRKIEAEAQNNSHIMASRKRTLLSLRATSRQEKLEGHSGSNRPASPAESCRSGGGNGIRHNVAHAQVCIVSCTGCSSSCTLSSAQQARSITRFMRHRGPASRTYPCLQASPNGG